jgi:hypothetical protein
MRVIALLLACLSAGCTFNMHMPEEKAFNGHPKAQTMTITWFSVEDSTAECKRLSPKMNFHPIVAACAFWNFEKRTCTVVTGKPTSHEILGHEMRHCFEGAFHD